MDFKSNRVTLFREQYEAINKLPVAIQGKVYKAVIDYNFTGIIPKLTGAAQLAFDLLKAGIDVSLAKQKAGQVGGRQNGSRGEAETKHEQSKTEAEAKQSESRDEAQVEHEQSKIEANDKQNGSSIEKSSVDKRSIEREEMLRASVPPIIPQGIFTPPRVEEVVAVGRKIGLSEKSCKEFYNYYAAQNWILNSGVPMNNLRSGLERWRRTEGKFASGGKSGMATNPRNYTKEQLDAYLGDTENFSDIEL